MSILSILGIGEAHAATSAAASTHQGGSFTTLIITMVLFAAVFYFLLVRPQSKRAKEHRQLMGQLSEGDEILTTGGMVGKVIRMKDNYLVISLSKDVEITMQKSAVANVLPKGTLDSLN